MELICREFDFQKELSQQRKLFIDCFPENIGTTVISNEHYNWKFRSFPSSNKPSYEYIAEIGDEMVGYYAAIPYRYKIGNREVQVGVVCDVMTNSRHRGKGIFTKLGQYSTEDMGNKGLAFTMGYPIRKEVIPGHLKVGWEIAFQMPLYIRFLNLQTFFKKKGLGFLGYFAVPFLWLYNRMFTGQNNKNYNIKIYNDFREIFGYEEFEKKWRESIPNALIKDSTFSQWRYGAPYKKYLFFCAYNRDKELVGMMSAREIVKEGVPSYGILDLMVTPENNKAINNLHNAIKQYARENKKEAIMTMMSRSSCKKYMLIKNGYLKSPFIFNLIIKNLSNEFSQIELHKESSWHLMFVDSDDL